MKRESKFQSQLIRELQQKMPGSYILKNDGSNVPQGFPDLLILNGSHWAALECKREANSARQPNQDFYVGKLNEMSFSRFISPENKEEVLDELYTTFGLNRSACISGSK